MGRRNRGSRSGDLVRTMELDPKYAEADKQKAKGGPVKDGRLDSKSDTPREAGGLMGWAASKAVGRQI
jgi:hypothetical protein